MAFESTSKITAATETFAIDLPVSVTISGITTNGVAHSIVMDLRNIDVESLVYHLTNDCVIKNVRVGLKKAGVIPNHEYRFNWDGRETKTRAQVLFEALKGMGKTDAQIKEIAGNPEKLNDMLEMLDI